MSIALNNEKLKDIFIRLDKNINDESATTDLLAILKHPIELTLEKYSKTSQEDMKSEFVVSILSKKAYLTKAYMCGDIADPTGYFFRLLRNSALAYLKKETRQLSHTIPITDVKVEFIAKQDSYRKTLRFMEIRDHMIDWIKLRFDNKVSMRRAIILLDLIMIGKKYRNCQEFFKERGPKADPVKRTYHIILARIKEVFEEYKDELIDSH